MITKYTFTKGSALKAAVASMACAYLAVVLGACQVRGNDPELEKEVRQAEQQRVQALLKGDGDALKIIWADDYSLITYRGDFRNRSHRLEAIRLGTLKMEAITNHIVDLRIYGDTALVHGIAFRKFTEKGRKVEGTFRFSRVWVKHDGRWQLSHAHFTRTQDK